MGERKMAYNRKTYPDHRRAFPPPPTTCFDARPNSTLPTLDAKFSVQKVSSTLYVTGEMQQNMSVLLSCEMESWRRCVSVELRNGTCF